VTCLGTPPAPTINVAPELGVDPHGVTPFAAPAVEQYIDFLALDGALEPSCGDRPCYAAGWTGP
jgi:hypothetical protein